MVSREMRERRSVITAHETPGTSFNRSSPAQRDEEAHSVADDIQLAEQSARQQRAAHTHRQQRKAAAIRAVAPEDLTALLGEDSRAMQASADGLCDSHLEDAIDQLL